MGKCTKNQNDNELYNSNFRKPLFFNYLDEIVDRVHTPRWIFSLI